MGLKKTKPSKLSWIKRHFKKAVALKLIVALLIANALRPGDYLKPHTVEEFAKTSVRLLGVDHGGSGVVLHSSDKGSEVLTNRHVCNSLEKGGIAEHEDKRYQVLAIKKSKTHDLCLVKVQGNLGVNTRVAPLMPRKYSDAFISGHPGLLPHVLTKGQFSGRIFITIEVDDGKPERLEAQLVSATILPGSSGSAVFDSNGEIAGMVFAGRGRNLTYALIVPQEYIRLFTDIESKVLRWQNVAKLTKEITEKSKRKTKELRILKPILRRQSDRTSSFPGSR